MRPGVTVGGVGVLVIAGLCLFVPFFDGYSVLYLAEQCQTGQLEPLSFEDAGNTLCDQVGRFTLMVYGLAGFGVAVTVVGAAARRQPKTGTVDQV